MIGEELEEFMWELSACMECAKLSGNKRLYGKLRNLHNAFDQFSPQDWEVLQSYEEDEPED